MSSASPARARARLLLPCSSIPLLLVLCPFVFTFYASSIVCTGERLKPPRREQIRTLLDRQTEQIFADCQAQIRKHEFRADFDRRSIPKFNEMIESQKEEIYRVHQGAEQFRRDQQFYHEQVPEQDRYLREAHEKSLSEME